MRVKTSAGDVELTADMVRRGMVFQDPTGAPYKLVRFDPYAVAWSDSDGALTEAEVAVAHTFLGCDPAIVAREDVERYGVAPDIDAGAHGFARLRDGGAVDLQRTVAPDGTIVHEHPNGRLALMWCDYARPRPLRRGERFVGLDARRARREDVLRLCCLDANRATSGPGGERCTLAIGDHNTHEDIAGGVTWAAKPDPADVAAWKARSEVPGTSESIQRATKAGAAAGMIQSCLARLVLQEVSVMAQDAEIVRGFFEAVRPTMTDERKAMLRGALRELLADP